MKVGSSPSTAAGDHVSTSVFLFGRRLRPRPAGWVTPVVLELDGTALQRSKQGSSQDCNIWEGNTMEFCCTYMVGTFPFLL